MSNLRRYSITDSGLSWLENMFEERYGNKWNLIREKKGFRLGLAVAESAILFDVVCESLTEPRSDQPCAKWSAESEGWRSPMRAPLPAPGVTVLPKPLIEKQQKDYVVHYDVITLIYWSLARVEEIGRKDLDKHQRFPATSSHAFKHGYLETPIVDEWLHILEQVIKRIWPSLVLKKHSFSMKVSHDVDRPSLYAFKPWSSIARMIAGDLLKRRNLESLVTAPYIKLVMDRDLPEKDPFNTFDWLMGLSEKNNLESAFYFLSGGADIKYDADYQIDHPAIRNLMGVIHRRGHELGLHPSYGMYQNPGGIAAESKKLRQVCAFEGIDQDEWGGRMHFLRWENPTTMRGWENAGMTYESTLSYADMPGFRCGTSFEYPAYDAVSGEALRLRIRPLIAMDASIISDSYLG